MDTNSFIEAFIKAKQKLSELKTDEDITEVVLICNPKVTDILERAIHEKNLKNIQIIPHPWIEKDKVCMVTDKEYIKNIRMMMDKNK